MILSSHHVKTSRTKILQIPIISIIQNIKTNQSTLIER